METPYAGRVLVNEFNDGAEIIISAKKNWFIIIFLSFWLCALLCFGTVFCTALIGTGADGARLFMYFLITFLTVNGLFAVKRLWWNFAGREIIHISSGMLTISRKGDVFKRDKSYELMFCKDFRAIEEQRVFMPFYIRTVAIREERPDPGTIKFDYLDAYTICFGDWLSEAEGKALIQKLRDKKLI